MTNGIAAIAAVGLLLLAGTAPPRTRSRRSSPFAPTQPGATIDANIYGQFMEHLGRNVYEGIWVGENSPIPNTRGYRNDMLAALKKLKVPVLRWPGGCFADEYHWRDGIGERAKRPHRVNTFWGGVIEPNEFGTHEFFELAETAGRQDLSRGERGLGHGRRRCRNGWSTSPRPRNPRSPTSAARTAATSRGSSTTSASATSPGAAAATCAPSTTRTNTRNSR